MIALRWVKAVLLGAAVAAAAWSCGGGTDAEARSLLRASRSGAAAAVTYGAAADTGSNMDATAASAYSAGTTYSYGDIASSGGLYYVSMADSNTGNALTSISKWTEISTFLYVSATGNDATCAPSTTPATAKASPCLTPNAVSKRTANLGGSAVSPNSMIAFERGGTYTGQLIFSVSRASQSITSLSGDGTTVTATTPSAHRLVSGTTVTITGATPAGYNTGGAVTVTVLTPTTFTYANVTTGASSGTIVYSNFYGNHFVGAYGTGARPILKYSDENSSTSSAQGATYVAWSNRAGLRIKDIEIDGEFSSYLLYTVGSGSFQAGETVNCSGGGSFTILRIPAVATGRLVIQNHSGTCSSGNTITGATSLATGTTTTAVGPVGGITARAECKYYSVNVHDLQSNGILLGNAGSAGSADNCTIKNSTIANARRDGSNGAGIDQGYGDNVTITQNTIYGNGSAGSTTNHNLYVQDLTNSTISRNSIYQTSDHGNHCIIVHGVISGLTIADNDCYGNNNGIGVNSGYATLESFDNVTIERNKIRQVGQLSGQTGGYGMLLSGLTSSTVRNNLIFGAKLGGMEIYEQTGATGTDGGDPVASATSFYHNTCYLTDTAISNSFWCLRIQGGLGAGMDFRNNIFYNASNQSNSYALSKDTATTTANLTLNNNLYYTPNAANSISWNAANVLTSGGIAAIRTAMSGATGAEAAGAMGNALFTAAASDDLTLQGGSPAKSLGAAVGITTDFRGSSRSGSTPSAGAYE